MSAKDYIKKVNFMINCGTNFDYKKEYEKLSEEDKKIVDEYLKTKEFTLD